MFNKYFIRYIKYYIICIIYHIIYIIIQAAGGGGPGVWAVAPATAHYGSLPCRISEATMGQGAP